jgi:methyl-accepting chemotaxis protein
MVNRLSTDNVPFFKSMRGKIVLVCVVMVLVVSAIIGLTTYYQSQATLQKLNSDSLKQSSTLVEANVVDTLKNNLAIVSTIANTEIAQSMDVEKLSSFLKTVNQKYTMFVAFYAVDPGGQTVASSSGASMNVADRAYFKSAMQGQVNISDPVVARDTGNVVIVFASPIQKDGKVIGAIIAANTTKSWATLMSSAQSGKSDEIYLVNQAGLFITPSRFSEELKAAGVIKTRSELELKDASLGASEALAGRSGVSEFSNYRGIQALGVYQPIQIENIKWGLISIIDKNEVNAPIAQLGILTLIIALVVALIFSILAFFIAQQLTHPLTAVARAARRIAVGDINQEIKVVNHDEVGVVAEAFQAMILYLRELAGAAEDMANGDLTVEPRPKSDQDVFGHAFTKMVANLRSAIDLVSENASNVGNASNQLAETSVQSDRAINQIALTIQQVAQGINQQADSVNKTAASTEQMSRAIDGVAKGAQEQSMAVSKASSMTAELSSIILDVARQAKIQAEGAGIAVAASETSVQMVENTVKGMETIKAKVDLSSNKVQEMGKRSEEIGSILETIEDIASQTNMLALNAAIEAARAGEHGKGFAVVADEVRKLAEKSAAATKEIAHLVGTIQQTVGEAVQAMDESSLEVGKGVSLAGESRQSLDAIYQAAFQGQQIGINISAAANTMSNLASELVSAMDTVSAVVEENTASTEEMAASSNEVTQSVEAIASVSEENSASVEEVSASAEEMSAQAEEISASAQSLAEMAKTLGTVVARFKLA